MKWCERSIATVIARHTFQRRCLLLVDNCQWTGHEADVLAVTQHLRLIDVEIKITRADLKADADKDKWWHRGFDELAEGKYVTPEPTARPWPRRIWKHYYAMPAAIWKPELFDVMPSRHSGVIVLQDNGIPKVVRRATPDRDAKPIEPADVLNLARLANLRLWDAYETIARMAEAEACP